MVSLLSSRMLVGMFVASGFAHAVQAADRTALRVYTGPGADPHHAQILAKNDFSGPAQNRDRILVDWSRRYSARPESK